MGNLCSKSANTSDNFSQPGRRLGGDTTTPQNKTSTPVPASVIASSPGRTLGGGQENLNQADPKSAAARAAEVSSTLMILRSGHTEREPAMPQAQLSQWWPVLLITYLCNDTHQRFSLSFDRVSVIWQDHDANTRFQERAAKANKPGGKLASELSKQKAKTQNQTLAEASRQELGARTADELAQTRAYN